MNQNNIWKKILPIGAVLLILSGGFYYLMGRILSQDGFFYLNNFSLSYFVLWGACIISFVLYALHNEKKESAGIHTPINECIHIFFDYKYLLKQLITRDFAVKYRRSYLGFIWVVLNPLLQMIILSAVFSFIFRFDIDKYPVYLILGQVTFNFYSEATTVAVNTIVESGQLIKKIYMPKYIFPLCKIMFSFLNYMISFIPVVVVLIVFRVPVSLNLVYLPLFFITFFIFTMGVGIFLAALNVKMRDVQYLYGIFITLANYFTPVFYPITALSPNMQKLMQFNPLFQYIDLVRKIVFEQKTPSLAHFAICIVWAVLALEIGTRFFYKKQDEFILYV